MGFAIFIVVGYVVAFPFLVWTRRDLRRMHPHLWTGFGSPYPWSITASFAYLAAGWPALVVASAWRFSPTRGKLMTIRRHSRERSPITGSDETEELRAPE